VHDTEVDVPEAKSGVPDTVEPRKVLMPLLSALGVVDQGAVAEAGTASGTAVRDLLTRCAELSELMQVDAAQLLRLDRAESAAREVQALLLAVQDRAALLVAEIKSDAVAQLDGVMAG
jgi:tRNA A58 N-methylase Trm61